MHMSKSMQNNPELIYFSDYKYCSTLHIIVVLIILI